MCGATAFLVTTSSLCGRMKHTHTHTRTHSQKNAYGKKNVVHIRITKPRYKTPGHATHPSTVSRSLPSGAVVERAGCWSYPVAMSSTHSCQTPKNTTAALYSFAAASLMALLFVLQLLHNAPAKIAQTATCDRMRNKRGWWAPRSSVARIVFPREFVV